MVGGGEVPAAKQSKIGEYFQQLSPTLFSSRFAPLLNDAPAPPIFEGSILALSQNPPDVEAFVHF